MWPEEIGKYRGAQVNETTIFDEGFWLGRQMGERKNVCDEIVVKEKLGELGFLRCAFKFLGAR